MEKQLQFADWLAINKMAARRSFARSIGKFQPQETKPVAILTAFRGERSLAENRAANAQLATALQRFNLGFYPVIGMGQEEKKRLFGLIRWVVPSSEESFVVQPRSEMREEEFEATIRNMLQKYEQYAAMVKLPGTAQAFLLSPVGERDYL